MIKIKYAILVLLLVTISVISGCAKIAEEEPIIIAYSPWPGYASLFIAKEKGFFTEEGVDVDMVKYDYLEELNAFANNEVDGHLKVFSDSIVQFSEGIATKSVFFTDASNGGDVIITTPEIQKIEDLKGKKIAIDGINSFSHIWVLTVLERNGLKENDVQFVNLEASDVPRALASGEIDAGHTWEPFVSQALEAGNHILVTTKEVHGIIVDDLAFHSKITEERPDDITSIIKALDRGVQFLQTNPQEAYDIVSKELEMDIEEVESFYQDAKMFDVEDNKQLMNKNTPNSIYETGEIISNFLLERGQLSSIPDFDEIIEPRFVNNIR